MEKISTQDLLILHAYGETNETQKQFLSRELASNTELAAEWYEIIKTRKSLSGILSQPSETSVRIVMEHSFKTEHLQETD